MSAAPPLVDVTKRLYVGAQNDAQYLIDAKPAASNDHPNHEADANAVCKIYSEPHAIRLAACWNACLGMPTSDVQDFAGVDRGFMRTVVLAGDREEAVAELLDILSEIKNEGLSWDPAFDAKIAAAAAKSNGEEVPRDLIPDEAPRPLIVEEVPVNLDIEAGVRKAVARVLCVPAERVQNHMDFISDLGADSLETVEITMALEDHFKIQIPDDDAKKITCVQQAIDYVTKVKA